MMNVTSEQIIGGYAVKYAQLVPLINKEYADSNDSSINIFINIGELFNKLTNPTVVISGYKNIVSSILNLCAHYRNFFRSYYKTDSTIYLIASILDEKSINNKFISGYGYNKNTNTHGDILYSTLNMLNTIIPYIPNIYLIKTNYEAGVVILDLNKRSNSPSLVITKDVYNYQLTVFSANKCTILRPKKYRGSDVSYMVNTNNLILSYTQDIGCARLAKVNPRLISSLMALSRVPSRNGLSGLYRIPSVLKALEILISKGIILNDRTNDIQYIIDSINNDTDISISINNESLVISRYNAIDLLSQYNIYSYSPDAININSSFIDLNDPKGLHELNMTVFKDCPIDLNVL